MKSISKQLKIFLNLATVQAHIERSFNIGLGNGVGFNDFVILYHLSQESGQKMRRIDLAEKVSLSASGITRLLLPMEKIGLVSREESKNDGRVSFVKLTPAGNRLLEEAFENAEYKAKAFLPSTDIRALNDLSEIFNLFSFKPSGQIIS